MEWAEATDPDPLDQVRYDLWLSSDPSFYFHTIVPGLDTGGYTFTEPVPEGMTMYWKVRAVDDGWLEILNTLQQFGDLQDQTTYYWKVRAVDEHSAASQFTSGTNNFIFTRMGACGTTERVPEATGLVAVSPNPSAGEVHILFGLHRGMSSMVSR